MIAKSLANRLRMSSMVNILEANTHTWNGEDFSTNLYRMQPLNPFFSLFHTPGF